MIVKLEDRRALIDLAKEYMNKYSINEIEALKMAENEVIFKGQRIIFDSKKQFIYTDCKDLIHESNVMSIYQEIERV